MEIENQLNTYYYKEAALLESNSNPDYRKGELGDAPKLNCNTCHQGAYKPLFGAPMAKDFPELKAPVLATKTAQASSK